MNLLDATLRRHGNVTWRSLEKDAVLLNLDSGTYYTLNEVGIFLWEHLNGDTPVRNLVEQVVEHYEVDPETARQDILELLEDLLREKLVERQQPGS